MRPTNDNELLFAEREQLFLKTLRKQLVWRHGNSSLRKHIRSHIAAIRGMRDARHAYIEGLQAVAARSAR
jgi:predicted HD phosphohydrolase